MNKVQLHVEILAYNTCLSSRHRLQNLDPGSPHPHLPVPEVHQKQTSSTHSASVLQDQDFRQLIHHKSSVPLYQTLISEAGVSASDSTPAGVWA